MEWTSGTAKWGIYKLWDHFECIISHDPGPTRHCTLNSVAKLDRVYWGWPFETVQNDHCTGVPK